MHPEVDVTVAGDFPVKAVDLPLITSKLNLNMATQPADIGHTRIQQRKEGTSLSTIDHILTSHQTTALIKMQAKKISDHLPVGICITLFHRMNNKVSIVNQDRISQGIRPAHIVKILSEKNWPRLPFSEVAKEHRYTQVCRFKKSNAHYLINNCKDAVKILSAGNGTEKLIQTPTGIAMSYTFTYSPTQIRKLTSAVTGMLRETPE